jgi:hypothetical protein
MADSALTTGTSVFVKHVVVPGAGMKVKQTIDGGKTWTDREHRRLQSLRPRGASHIDPVDPKVGYLGPEPERGARPEARSQQTAASTWTKLGAGLPPRRSLALARTAPAPLYCGSYGGAIHRKPSDSGHTWTRIEPSRTEQATAPSRPSKSHGPANGVTSLLKSDSNTSGVLGGACFRTVTGGE